MKPSCVGFDLDGVLYDWHLAVYTHYVTNKKFEGSYEEFWSSWKEYIPEEDIEYLVSVPTLYEAVIAPKRTISILENLSEFCEIYYITARPQEAKLVTERYLRKSNFPQWFNLSFSCDKGIQIRQYGIEYYLDDNPKIVKNVKNLTNAFLLDKIYYRDQQDGLSVVNSLQEFSNIVAGGSSV